MSEEADKALDERGEKIAIALGDKAEAADIACAKLLVELADRKKRKPRKPRVKKAPESAATRYASEAEWPRGGAEAHQQVESGDGVIVPEVH